MRLLGKQLIAVSLAASLAAAPLASATKPLGMVVKADAATLGRSTVQEGTNVYAGDRAITARLGQLQMNLGKAQIYLGAESEALLQENDNRVLVYLTRGSAGFAAQGETVLVHAAGTWVRPQTAGATQAEIRLVSEREFLVTAKNGPVEVVLENELMVVPQNQTARVSIAPDDMGQDRTVEGVGKKEVRRIRLRGAIIATGAIIGIVLPIILSNTHDRGPSTPVSPSVP